MTLVMGEDGKEAIEFMSNFRKLSCILFLFSAALLASAYWLEYVMIYIPCSLCILQRGVYWLIFLLFGLGVLLTPKQHRMQMLFVIGGILLALVGMALTGRQIWMMHLPPEAVPSCSAGLERLMQQMPMWEAVLHVIQAPGDCAESNYTFLKLPLVYWSLAGFSVVLVFCGEWIRQKKKVD